MDKNQCQVCGYSRALLCYNAVVCNACRTFFYRCVLYDPPDVCRNDKKCVMVPGVSKIKKRKNFFLQVQPIPQRTMVAMVSDYHPLLFQHDHNLSALTIDSVLLWHNKSVQVAQPFLQSFRLSLNESGKNPSALPVNMNVSLTEACIDRIKNSDPNIMMSYSRIVCRWMVSFVDFLVSTHYFNEFSPQDKKFIVQNNIMDFKLYCLLECRLKYGLAAGKAYCEQFAVKDYERIPMLRALMLLDKLFVTTFQPLYEELIFDELESTAVKVIAMYSPVVELSDDGVKKAAFARDAFTLKLTEHIKNTRPELTHRQQLERLSKLLGVIKDVKTNYGDLYGRITSDMYVNSNT